MQSAEDLTLRLKKLRRGARKFRRGAKKIYLDEVIRLKKVQEMP